ASFRPGQSSPNSAATLAATSPLGLLSPGMLACAAGQVNHRYRAAAIQLLSIIFIAMLGTAAAAIAAIISRRRKLAATWFGACLVVATSGVLLLESWNRVMLRVNQMAPTTQDAR